MEAINKKRNIVQVSAIGNIKRENTQEKFRRLEKLRVIFVVLFVLIGTVIIQFPLPNSLGGSPIEFNFTGIYITVALLVGFAFLWHRFFNFRLKEETKLFIETVIYIIGIHFIVGSTGGT